MKKLLCILLSGIMLTVIMLTGCGKDDLAASGGNTLPEDASPEEAKYDSITIGGIALSEFQIVYADDPMASLKADNPGKYDVGESAYAELIAQELSTVLENMTGVKVPTVEL